MWYYLNKFDWKTFAILTPPSSFWNEIANKQNVKTWKYFLVIVALMLIAGKIFIFRKNVQKKS